MRADFFINSGATVTLSNQAILISSGSINIRGTLNASAAREIRLSRDWNSEGQFVPGTSTVTFYNQMTSSITGNSTFYCLSSVQAGKTIQFQNGSTQTVTHLLISGEAGNEIKLTPTQSGATWYLNSPDRTQNVEGVEVENSIVSNSLVYAYGLDGGGNVNWLFNTISGLTALTGSVPTSIQLSWTAPRSDATEYRIQYATFTNVSWNIDSYSLKLATSGVALGDNQGYLIKGLEARVTYYFRIWTSDILLRWSGISNAATAWAQTINDSPYALTDLVVTDQLGDAGGAISVSWSHPVNPENDLAEYELYRATAPQVLGYTLIHSTVTSKSSYNFIDGNLPDGVTYYYMVTSSDTAMEDSSGIGLTAVTSDYVNVPDGPALDITGPFTLEMWAMAQRDLTEMGNQWYGGLEKYQAYGLAWSGWTDGWSFRFFSGAAVKSVSPSNIYLTTGAWYHVVGVYDGNYLRLYQNGSLISSSEIGPFTVDTNNNPFKIGVYWGSPNGYFDGVIDEVRLYERALSTAEVYNNYLDTVPITTQGLVSWWKMNGTTNDYLGNSAAGTRNGKAHYSVGRKGVIASTFSVDNPGPDSIKDLSALMSNLTPSAVELSWTHPETLTEGCTFFIQYTTSSNLSFSTTSAQITISSPAAINANDRRGYTVRGLEAGNTFYFRLWISTLTVGSPTSTSDRSNLANAPALPINDSPQGITDLEISSWSANSYTLTWSEAANPENDLVRYGIYRSSSPQTIGYQLVSASAAGQGTYSYADGGIAAGVTYYYLVRSSDSYQDSAALRFDPVTPGASDYISIADGPTLDITGAFTLEAWVNPARDLTEEGDRWWGIIEKQNAYALGWNGWYDGYTFRFYNGGTPQSVNINNHYLSKDVWYHVVGVYDGSSVKIYENGVVIGSQETGSLPVDTNSNAFKIGVVWGSPNGHFDGVIDEVRLYDRALSTAEIFGNYLDTTSVTTQGLVSWWKLNHKDIVDYMRNNNGTTPSGNPYVTVGRRGRIVATNTRIPDVITTLSALTGSVPSSIQLSWVAPSNNSTEYRIQYATWTAVNWEIDAYSLKLATAGVLKGDNQGYLVKGLEARATYYFRIWSSNNIPVWSGISNSATSWALGIDQSPLGVTSLQLVNPEGSVQLSWTEPPSPENDVVAYNIYRSTSPNTLGYTLVSSSASGEDFYTYNDGQLQGETSYYYVVKSSDSIQESGALHFNGITDRVTLSQNSAFNSMDMSLSMWIRPTVVRNHTIAFKDLINSWRIYQNNTGNIEFDALADGYNLISVGQVSTGTWAHLTCTFDSTAQEMKIYLNGALDNTASGIPTVGSTYPILIELAPAAATRFHGDIDEVMCYNRALTAGEVFNNYLDTMIVTTNGLMGWWKFNNNVEDYLQTSDGSIVGSPVWIDGRRGNVVTVDKMTPGSVSNLTALMAGTDGDVSLSWTFPGNNRFDGDLELGSRYAIKASTVNFGYFSSTAADFGSADYDVTLNTVAVAGSAHQQAVTGLNPGTTYYFGVIVRDDSGNWSTWEKIDSANQLSSAPAVDLALGDPTLVSALIPDVGSTTIRLSWLNPAAPSYVDDRSSYRLYTATYGFTSASDPAVAISSIVAHPLQNATTAGVVPNTTYYFRVSAVDSGTVVSGLYSQSLESALSSLYSTSTLAAIPVPLEFDSADVLPTTITLRWQSAGNSTGTLYQAWISTSSDFAAYSSSNTVYSFSVTTYPVVEGTTRYFKIRAKNNCNLWSDWSVSVSTWFTDMTAPAAVTTLSGLKGATTGSILLSWVSPGDNGTVGTLPSGSQICIATTTVLSDATDESYWLTKRDDAEIQIATSGVVPFTRVGRAVTGLAEGVTYYFRIWIRDEIGNWSPISNAATSYPYTSLLGWWKFDDGSGTRAHDYSGNNRNATLTGIAWVTGEVEGAINFDNNADKCQVTDNGTIRASSYTLTAWVKRSGAQCNYCAIFFKEYPFPSYSSFDLTIDPTASDDSKIETCMGYSGGATCLDSVTGALPDGVWTFVAATYDKQNLRLYINGVQDANSPVAETREPIYDNSSVNIGAPNFAGNSVMGSIDDARIYNRALSAAEIQALYNAVDKGYPGPISDLTALIGAQDGEVDLKWTSPGDDGTKGDLNNAQYRIRYSTRSFNHLSSTYPMVSGSAGFWDILRSTSLVQAKSQLVLTVTGLNPGTSYYFGMIVGDDNMKWSTYTVTGNINRLSSAPAADLALDPPTEVSALGDDVSSTSIRLSWIHPPAPANVDDRYSYRMYVASYAFVASTNPAVALSSEVLHPLQNATTAGILPNTTYYFRIAAVDSGTITAGLYSSSVVSGLSLVYATATFAVIPGTLPFSSSDIFLSSITLRWSESGNPSGTFYQAQISTSSDFAAYSSSETSGTVAVTTATLLSQNTYYFRVRARNLQNLFTDWSVLVSTHAFDTVSPSVVTSLSALTGDSTGTIKLSWVAPGDDASVGSLDPGRFRIFYSSVSEDMTGLVVTTPETFTRKILEISTANVAPFSARMTVLTGLMENVTYYARIFTGDDVLNWSAVSNGATAQAQLMILSVSFSLSQYNFETIPIGQSTHSASAVVVTNNGNVPVTYLIRSATATPGTPWGVGADENSAPTHDKLLLRGVFHNSRPSTAPVNQFDTDDVINSANQSSNGTRYTVNADVTETGVAVPVSEPRNLWWFLQMPLTTSTTWQQKINVTVTATQP